MAQEMTNSNDSSSRLEIVNEEMLCSKCSLKVTSVQHRATMSNLVVNKLSEFLNSSTGFDPFLSSATAKGLKKIIGERQRRRLILKYLLDISAHGGARAPSHSLASAMPDPSARHDSFTVFCADTSTVATTYACAECITVLCAGTSAFCYYSELTQSESVVCSVVEAECE